MQPQACIEYAAIGLHTSSRLFLGAPLTWRASWEGCCCNQWWRRLYLIVFVYLLATVGIIKTGLGHSKIMLITFQQNMPAKFEADVSWTCPWTFQDPSPNDWEGFILDSCKFRDSKMLACLNLKGPSPRSYGSKTFFTWPCQRGATVGGPLLHMFAAWRIQGRRLSPKGAWQTSLGHLLHKHRWQPCKNTRPKLHRLWGGSREPFATASPLGMQ